MKQNQRGVVNLGLLIVVLIVLAAFCVIGYGVYRTEQSKRNNGTSPAAKKPEPEAAKSWTGSEYAIKGKYADADVLKIDDTTWRMYYAIQPEVQPNNFEIYSATSTDGKNWTTEPGTRKTMATFPDVIKLKDGRYRMYFQSAGVIKSAISSDGLNFTDEPGTRVDPISSENLPFDNVAAPTTMQKDDGTFVMVYRASLKERYAANTPNPNTNLLMWATSKDGLEFTMRVMAVDTRNDTFNGALDGPEFVKWDDGYTRLFTTTYTGVYSLTFNGMQFINPRLEYAYEAKKDSMGFRGMPPGDPTLAEIGGTWFMYFGLTGDRSGIHYAEYK